MKEVEVALISESKTKDFYREFEQIPEETKLRKFQRDQFGAGFDTR